MTDREAILGALPRSKGGKPLDCPFGGEDRVLVETLWRRFRQALEALGGRMVETNDLESLVGKPVRIDEDAMLLVAGLPWTLTDDPWDAEAGITVARIAVAESGSLLLSSGEGRARLTSLAPPLHVCLVQRESIVPNLAAAFAMLDPENSVLITGPSRTADIEGVIVRGVHGPKELWVLVT